MTQDVDKHAFKFTIQTNPAIGRPTGENNTLE